MHAQEGAHTATRACSQEQRSQLHMPLSDCRAQLRAEGMHWKAHDIVVAPVQLLHPCAGGPLDAVRACLAKALTRLDVCLDLSFIKLSKVHLSGVAEGSLPRAAVCAWRAQHDTCSGPLKLAIWQLHM